MSPEVTRRKLKLLIQNIDLLKKYKSASITAINRHHLEIERLLHLVIEIMGDINYHLIVRKAGKPPQNLRESFIEMGNIKIIDPSLAKDLAPSAGLRNALIHMYDNIEIKFIQKSIVMALKLIPKYIKQVEKNI